MTKDDLIYWFAEKKSMILWGSAGGLALLVALVQWVGRSGGSSQQEYQAAAQAYERWSEEGNETLLQELDQKMRRYPELQAKFNGKIAQKLLTMGQGEKAAGYAARPLGRLQAECPDYAAFARTTLLIGQQKWPEALEESKKLKESLKERSSLLYAFNLLRIAMLEKEQSHAAAELAAWSELEASGALAKLQKNFREQNLSLADFITQRRTSLQ